jgi:hypothetical protein
MYFVVAIHHADDYDAASVEDPGMINEISALNQEMIAAGVRAFVGGLEHVCKAKTLRGQPDGAILVTDGPYLETKEHMGGFWVLDVEDEEAALGWARKAVKACRTNVEVRRLFQRKPQTQS